MVNSSQIHIINIQHIIYSPVDVPMPLNPTAAGRLASTSDKLHLFCTILGGGGLADVLV